MPLRSAQRSADITAPGPKRPLHWRTFVTLMTWVCKACFIDGKRGDGVLPCFPTMLCREVDIYPVYKIANWQQKIGRRIAKHYKESHPDWPFKVKGV